MLFFPSGCCILRMGMSVIRNTSASNVIFNVDWLDESMTDVAAKMFEIFDTRLNEYDVKKGGIT